MTAGFEFVTYPKIARLNREIIITEKIDGTNAAIQVRGMGGLLPGDPTPEGFRRVSSEVLVAAQSRTRIITPESDNFGFARWVHEHAAALATLLGYGVHFGEWWGAGVQRTYGLKTKAFSLFNVTRWADVFSDGPLMIGGVPVNSVPVLYRGDWISEGLRFAPEFVRAALRIGGSVAAPGFLMPEGIVVFHSASGQLFKATIEKDEKPKGVA